jgi:N-acyl-L-homoserine lactone synthetase
MEKQATFKSYITSATELPSQLKEQFLKLRYKCGIQGDPICYDHIKKMDIDRFDDMASTIYIVATKQENGKETVVTGSRIMPTIIDYEFEDPIWEGIIKDRSLPKSPDIYAGGRWVNKYIINHEGWTKDESLKAHGFIANGLMLMGFYQACEQNGVKTIIGWPSPRIVKFGETNDMEKRYSETLISSGGDGREIKLVEYDINQSLYRMGREAYNKGMTDIKRASETQII